MALAIEIASTRFESLIHPFFFLPGGLFGQKPATGFGASFGTPASSAATGFSGLGTFTPAGGKL